MYMRKIVLGIVLSLVCSVIVAQETKLKFLGIPVDGSKKEFFDQLKEKGFEIIEYEGEIYAEGEFNGKNSIISARTVNRKIDRVVVQWGEYISEGQIKIVYNDLIKQFENNGKYISMLEKQNISENEDIEYEMAIHDKQYQAAFYLIEDVARLTDSMEKFKNSNPEYESMEEDELNRVAYDILERDMAGFVWITIESLPPLGYKIIIYYDNTRNSATGEDL